MSARNISVALTRFDTFSEALSPSFMKIELTCFSTARFVRTSESAIAALLFPSGHLGEHLTLALSELGQRRVIDAGLGLHEQLHDLGIDHRPAASDGVDRGHQLATVVYALLQQVAAAIGATLEQRQDVRGVGELAEDDHSGRRARLTQLVRDSDALVGVGRRHPDVRQNDVGSILLHRAQQCGDVPVGPDHFDTRCPRE